MVLTAYLVRCWQGRRKLVYSDHTLDKTTAVFVVLVYVVARAVVGLILARWCRAGAAITALSTR